MLFKNTIITTLLFVMTSAPAVSFQISDTAPAYETDRNHMAINEDNFPCFRDLKCLINENPFPDSNLGKIELNNNRSTKYVVEGSSKQEEIYAEYNGKGELVKATVIQRNIKLPRGIYEVLVTGGFESWSMIGNELVIQNFDKGSMLYKVVLKKEDDVRVEYFDRHGNLKNRFS